MSLTDKFKEFATLFHIINDSLNETRETQTTLTKKLEEQHDEIQSYNKVSFMTKMSKQFEKAKKEIVCLEQKNKKLHMKVTQLTKENKALKRSNIPSVSEVVPSVSEVVPSVSEVVPSVSEVVPSVSEVVPSVSEVVPSVSDVVDLQKLDDEADAVADEIIKELVYVKPKTKTKVNKLVIKKVKKLVIKKVKKSVKTEQMHIIHKPKIDYEDYKIFSDEPEEEPEEDSLLNDDAIVTAYTPDVLPKFLRGGSDQESEEGEQEPQEWDVKSKYQNIQINMGRKLKTYFVDIEHMVYKKRSDNTMKLLGKLSEDKLQILKL